MNTIGASRGRRVVMAVVAAAVTALAFAAGGYHAHSPNLWDASGLTVMGDSSVSCPACALSHAPPQPLDPSGICPPEIITTTATSGVVRAPDVAVVRSTSCRAPPASV